MNVQHEAPVRVVIVDDQAMVRAGLRGILDAEATVDVVADAANGLEAVHVVAETRPDVVLMDLQMPKLDGVDATALVTRPSSSARPRVIVLTTVDLDAQAFAALRVGASGFLMKDTTTDGLVAAIHVVAADDALLRPAATRRLIEAFVEPTSATASVNPTLASLTDREREVFELVGRGWSNAQIADRLDIDLIEAGACVGVVLEQLGLRDRVGIVILAHEAGLVPPRR